MPLVDLGKTLYCSKFGDSGFEAALVVPWFLLSFLERFSTLKFGLGYPICLHPHRFIPVWEKSWSNEVCFRVCVYRL
ncbi:hypothetical protein Hanom_Chr13g01231731 [Helianthus anomalus]